MPPELAHLAHLSYSFVPHCASLGALAPVKSEVATWTHTYPPRASYILTYRRGRPGSSVDSDSSRDGGGYV